MSYDEPWDRCEALVGKLREALGEAPDEKSFEDEDGMRSLDM